MKRLTALFLAMALTISLAACGQSAPPASSVPAESPSAPSVAESQPEPSQAPQAEKIDVKIAALKGPTAMGMVKMMEDAAAGGTANNYDFTLAGAPDELVGKIVQGEIDIAAVPTNLAATLYNKTEGKVKMASLVTKGVLYIVEKGDTIQSMSDLAGKTIYATGKGSTAEFALNYLLDKNGLTDQVKVEYKGEHTELATMLAAGQADIALLPQPFVTSVLMQNESVRVALDLTAEWDKVTSGESGLVMSAVIIQQKFIDEHPDAVKAFLAEYESSVNFVNDPVNLDAAAKIIVAKEIMAAEPAAKKALPQCSIVFIAGEQMKQSAQGFLQVLFDANPQSVGGKLPDESFYYLG